jgi:hypothetical protein
VGFLCKNQSGNQENQEINQENPDQTPVLLDPQQCFIGFFPSSLLQASVWLGDTIGWAYNCPAMHNGHPAATQHAHGRQYKQHV